MGIESLRDQTLVSITGMYQGSGEIIFTTTTGRRFRMYHYQDCCESVVLEDVCGDAEDLIGSPINTAEERSMAGPSRYESSTWTFYELASNYGSVTLRWLGVSNGYYSERVSFEEIEPLPTPKATCGACDDPSYCRSHDQCHYTGTALDDLDANGQGISIVEINDETTEVRVNGTHVTTLTHDEDGWQGMRRVETVLEETARILGVPFRRG